MEPDRVWTRLCCGSMAMMGLVLSLGVNSEAPMSSCTLKRGVWVERSASHQPRSSRAGESLLRSVMGSGMGGRAS